MWQLICHHEYGWGSIPADRSPWRSDGLAVDVNPLPGEVGLRFSTPNSRVVIPRRQGDPWGVLRGIYVEMTARYFQGGGTLIDADQSFRIRFNASGHIIIEALGQEFDYGMGDVPAGAWIAFSFGHNGFNEAQGSYAFNFPDGDSTAGETGPRPAIGQISGVGPEGVWIGSRIGAPAAHLNGDIARLKIWRIDPDHIIKTFLGRPFTPSLLECWGQFIRKINESFASHPECAVWLVQNFSQMQDHFLQMLARKSPEKIAEFWAMCAAYQDLWKAGKVGSPEMQALVTRMRDWQKAERLYLPDDPDFKHVFENPCIKTLTAGLPMLDCDADAQALLGALLGKTDG